MGFSYVTYTGTGSQQQYTVTFPYISRLHVKVYVNGLQTSFAWINDAVVSITPAPANGLSVVIKRETPTDAPLVDFTDGGRMSEDDLDLLTRQSLYALQEDKENRSNELVNYSGLYSRVAALEAGGVAQSGSIYYLGSYSSLAEALSIIGSSPGVLVVSGQTDITSNTTIPTTLQVRVDGVGCFNISSGVTLTMNIPSAPSRQIFYGSGSVAYHSTDNDTIYAIWYGAKRDSGTTDNTSAINKALSSGMRVWLNGGSGFYQISSSLNIAVEGTQLWSNNALITQAGIQAMGINITASHVHIEGVHLRTPHSVTSSPAVNEIAIKATGADSSHYLTNITITRCEIFDWRTSGCAFQFVENFMIDNTRFTNLSSFGVNLSSCSYGSVRSNRITTVLESSYGAGIVLSRLSNSSGELTTNPRCSDVHVYGNSLTSISGTGIKAFGASNCSIALNRLMLVNTGIYILYSPNNSSAPTYASEDITVVNNFVHVGTGSTGIIFIGATNSILATGSISGNTLKNCGGGSTSSGGMYLTNTAGLVINGNIIVEPARLGIVLDTYNLGFVIEGNTITDPWSATYNSFGIYTLSDYNTGIVSGNFFRRGTKSATNVANYAIHASPSTPNNTGITLGKNYCEFENYTTVSGLDYYAKGHGQISCETMGNTESALATTRFAPHRLSNASQIRFSSNGDFYGTNNTKTLKLYFSTYAVTLYTASAGTTGEWRVEGEITICSSTTAYLTCKIFVGTSVVYSGRANMSVGTDFYTNGANFSLAGLCASASDIIHQYTWYVDYK